MTKSTKQIGNATEKRHHSVSVTGAMLSECGLEILRKRRACYSDYCRLQSTSTTRWTKSWRRPLYHL